MQKNLEVLEQSLFNLGRLNIANSITIGRKNDDGNRLSGISSMEYQSEKYKNWGLLKRIGIRYNKYLTYKIYNDNVRYSASFSDTSISHLIDKTNHFSDEILPTCFKKKQSGWELINDDLFDITGTIGAISYAPTIIERKEKYIRGIRLFVESESTYQDLTISNFLEYIYFLNNFNLYLSSQILFLTGMTLEDKLWNIRQDSQISKDLDSDLTR